MACPCKWRLELAKDAEVVTKVNNWNSGFGSKGRNNLHLNSSGERLTFPNRRRVHESIRGHLQNANESRQPSQIAKKQITRPYLLDGGPARVTKARYFSAGLQELLPSDTSK